MLLGDDRGDAYLPLSETGLPAEAAARLAALGITTLEELRDAWTYGNRQLLTDYLGESPVRFTMVRPSAILTRSAASHGPGDSINLMAAGPVRPLVRHAQGVLLSDAQRKRRAGAPEVIPATARRETRPAAKEVVSLINRFPPVRDQGGRGTCVAFASAAYLEYHLAAEAKAPRRSEQYLYWACKELDRFPGQEGTTLTAARRALEAHGVCLNKTWKYQPLPLGPTEGQGPPPAKTVTESKANRWTTAKDQPAGKVDMLRSRLDEGRPVVLTVLTFSNLWFPSTTETGEITLPLPLSAIDGAHAVCLVGYERRPVAPGGGAFLFRNSWGKTWASRSRYKPGYGTLLFEYVRQYSLEAYA